MKKSKRFFICIVTVLVFGGFGFIKANEIMKFTDKDGNIITVKSNSNLKNQTPLETNIVEEFVENPKVGDVININGIEEEVIAISEDGAFITLKK